MRLADLRGRSVAIWGTDREGRAAVTAIARHQPSRLITVDDSADHLSVEWTGELAALAPLAGGDHAFAALASADVVVRSPAVPSAHPYLAELAKRGITVTGGSALWMAENAARAVGVTGSKGRTATSGLISHLLTATGRPNVHGGSIEMPLLALPPAEQYVLELSGHQCADLAHSPRVAVITSLFPEHLELPGTAKEDHRDKLNLLGYGPELVVVNANDERLRDEIRGIAGAGRLAPVPAAAGDSRFRVEDDRVWCGDEALFSRDALVRKGRLNGEFLCVALAVLDGMGVDVVRERKALEAAVRSFQGPPHRLAEIDDPSGLTFVDDTFSTGPYAALHAVEVYESRPLTVLVGGTERGQDYTPLRDFLSGRELTVIGLPDSGPRALSALSRLPLVRTEQATDLVEAVRLARKITPAGGVVLLSPASPGHGRFRTVEHRSEVFARAVRETAQ